MSNPLRRRSPSDPDAMIASLAEQSINIAEIAQAHSISTTALLRWCASASADKRFKRHASLYHQAAHIALSRASARAAHALLDLALDHAAPETARKACVDLIKLAPPGAQPHQPETPNPHPDDDAALRALSEKLTTPTEPTNP